MKPSRKTVLVSGITSWAPSSLNRLVGSDVFLDVSLFSGRDGSYVVPSFCCVVCRSRQRNEFDGPSNCCSTSALSRSFIYFFMNTILMFLTGCSSRSAAKLACPKFASQTRIVQIWQCLHLHDRSPTAFHWPMNEFLWYFSFFLSFVVKTQDFYFILCHFHGYN